jgi:hypothetical protein
MILSKLVVWEWRSINRSHTDRFPDDVPKKLRQNRNRDSCEKSATGAEKTEIWRIPTRITNLGGKGFSHPKNEMAQRWQEVFRPVSTAWHKVPVVYNMGRTGRPSRNTNLGMILSSLVVWEWRSIDVSLEQPVKRNVT